MAETAFIFVTSLKAGPCSTGPDRDKVSPASPRKGAGC
jgi:hypothetical protein